MKNLLLVTVISLFVLCIPSLTMASEDTLGCGAYVPTIIKVEAVFEETAYDYSTPMIKIAELAKANQETVKGSKHTEQWPVGLTVGEMFFSSDYGKLKMLTPVTLLACGQISEVNIKFGFKNNKILVAKEFPKRSCPYREVLRHEEKHKAVDQQLVQEYSEKIKTVLGEVTKKIGVVKAPTPAIIDDKIDSTLNQAMQKLIKEIEAEHIARQKKVDTAEEYQRITDSCDGQTMEIVRQRLQILEDAHPGSTKASE